MSTAVLLPPKGNGVTAQPRRRKKTIEAPTESVSIERVGPTFGYQALQSSVGNRKRKVHKIRQLEDAIATDHFYLSWDALCFDESGALRNGHNRMEALVNVGKTDPSITIPVIILRKTFQKLSLASGDTGTSRSTSDILKMFGYKNCHILAATASNVWLYTKERLGIDGAVRPTAEQVLEFLGEHPELIDDIKISPCVTINRAQFATLKWITSHQSSTKYAEKYLEFENIVARGECGDGNNPAMRFRQWRISQLGKRGHHIKARQALGTMFKAWNKFVAGESMSTGIALRRNEPFPDPTF